MSSRRTAPMNEDLRISQHAIERFAERVERLNGVRPYNPEKLLRKMLSRAKPDDSMDEQHRVFRMLQHKAYDTEYLRADAWRFVVKGGVVVTVEHTTHHKN